MFQWKHTVVTGKVSAWRKNEFDFKLRQNTVDMWEKTIDGGFLLLLVFEGRMSVSRLT